MTIIKSGITCFSLKWADGEGGEWNSSSETVVYLNHACSPTKSLEFMRLQAVAVELHLVKPARAAGRCGPEGSAGRVDEGAEGEHGGRLRSWPRRLTTMRLRSADPVMSNSA